ncbi:hypothetical protein D3C76_1503080 [compost metagenome]
MRQSNLCDFTQLLRQRLQTDFLLQQLDIINLSHCSSDRLVQISCLTVDDPVNGITHIPHNPYILKLEQGLMRTNDAEQLNNFLAFLNV